MKKRFLFLILIIIIVLIYYGIPKIDTLSKWKVVKNDFENINQIASNYFSENKDNELIIKHSENANDFISMDLDSFSVITKSEKGITQNIKKYFKENAKIYYGNSIRVIMTDNYTRYFTYTEKGMYEVIYYKNKPNFNELLARSLEHLTEGWYQTVYIHHI